MVMSFSDKLILHWGSIQATTKNEKKFLSAEYEQWEPSSHRIPIFFSGGHFIVMKQI
jgi:hypothetical protein